MFPKLVFFSSQDDEVHQIMPPVTAAFWIMDLLTRNGGWVF